MLRAIVKYSTVNDIRSYIFLRSRIKILKMPSTFNFQTISPNEYKRMKDFQITYGMSQTKFGNCLIGLNEQNICFLSFFDEGKENTAIEKLNGDWPNADLTQKDEAIGKIVTNIFDSSREAKKFNVLLKGTDLQVNVWKELAKLKEGTTANYEQIAKAVGNPRAIRAVASACAKNKIAYVIPCHRVIRKTGISNKYRWGPERRHKILKYETEGDN